MWHCRGRRIASRPWLHDVPTGPPTTPCGPARCIAARCCVGGAGGLGLRRARRPGRACSSEGDTVAEGVEPRARPGAAGAVPRDVAFVAAESPVAAALHVRRCRGRPGRDRSTSPVTFTITFDGEQVGDPVEVESHSDGVPRPYLPLYTTFPRPGPVRHRRDATGDTTLNSQVQVHLAADVAPAARRHACCRRRAHRHRGADLRRRPDLHPGTAVPVPRGRPDHRARHRQAGGGAAGDPGLLPDRRVRTDPGPAGRGGSAAATT